MKGCRPLSDAEVELVQHAFVGRYAVRNHALFTLGLYTGFRIAELLSLRVADVWNGTALLDRVHVSRRNMKKQLEGRTVPLHDRAKVALAAWLEIHLPNVQPTAPLFPGYRGATEPMSRVGAWRVLKTAYNRAGLTGPGLATHSMRKSFAARVYEVLGHDLVKTQKAMGHRNINSTVSYIGFLDSDVDNAILAA